MITEVLSEYMLHMLITALLTLLIVRGNQVVDLVMSLTVRS